MNEFEAKELPREEKYIKINVRSLYISVIFILLVVVLVLSYFLFDKKSGGKVEQTKQDSTRVQNDSRPPGEQGNQNSTKMEVTAATDATAAELVKKVFQHIFLPSGDVRIETIVDAEKLRKANPIFYQLAQTGDKILFYSDRAILYNPSVDKVLDVYRIVK